MSATGAIRPTGAVDERSDDRSNGRAHIARRLVTETKASFPRRPSSSPFWSCSRASSSRPQWSTRATAAASSQAGVAVRNDPDRRLTVSRGLAKAGSSQPYDEDRS